MLALVSATEEIIITIAHVKHSKQQDVLAGTHPHLPLVVLSRAVATGGLKLGASGVPRPVSSLEVDLQALGIEVGHRGEADDQAERAPPAQHHVLGGGEGISVVGRLVGLLQRVHASDRGLSALACTI